MSSLQEWKVAEPWLDTHCSLGEGPFFEQQTNSVRFVDIQQKRLHSASLKEGIASLETIQLDVPVTVTANIEGFDPAERILIGMKSGLAVLNRKSGSYEVISRFTEPQNDRLRSNDGASDAQGRFWIGTMTDFGQGDFRPEGSLYRFDGKLGNEELLKDLVIPNSVGWSPDNQTMYFTHSQTRQVFAFDYSVSTGAATNKRVFYLHDGPGEPDGFRVDVEGNIWHAVYGESRVLKIDTSGKLVGQISLPTKNITCVQFAGTELVITTAADNDVNSTETSRRYGGAVFRIDVGVEGLPLFEFKLN